MTSFNAKTAVIVHGRVAAGAPPEIDPSTWKPLRLKDGPSLWGNERVWLPPADSEVAREMRMRAAAAAASNRPGLDAIQAAVFFFFFFFRWHGPGGMG